MVAFVCEFCDSDCSSNRLIRYCKPYINRKGEQRFTKGKFICPSCYEITTGNEYDFYSYFHDENYDSIMNNKYIQYIDYMKKRMGEIPN